VYCAIPTLKYGGQLPEASSKQTGAFEMREILKLGEELRSRMIEETEIMLAERALMHDIAETRGRELLTKREEELRRIERWTESQKAVVADVFSAMIAENEVDKQKHESAIRRLNGEGAPVIEHSSTKFASLMRKAS
jgi:hypothetical protein